METMFALKMYSKGMTRLLAGIGRLERSLIQLVYFQDERDLWIQRDQFQKNKV
jgi:hypothetical protein